MEEWILRALKRWPNVPALFGWLKLDRRGRWLIKGEVIGRTQIIDVINRNYAADEYGRWYFQNGPQRGYMQLEYAPLILRVGNGETLVTHTGVSVQSVREVFMDEEGALLLVTEHGPGAIIDDELEWALQQMFIDGQPIREEQLAIALAMQSGCRTEISLRLDGTRFPLTRLDAAAAPERLHFVRDPQPL